MAAVASPDTTTTAPAPVITPREETREARAPGFLVICWNDPVNLMSYVVHVFQKVFGWDRRRAEKHMLEVHEKGRSVLVRESFEEAEAHVHQLQAYSLEATVERDDP
jgi:ATP-dependent Clp protease adaptor protein ClpS